MSIVKATPLDGARVRKPDGTILKPDGEAVERSAFWLRREKDGDVSLADIEPAPVKEANANVNAKPKK